MSKMSCDIDELDVNPFFRALQTTFSNLYEKAQEKCYLVCVPQKASLGDVTINQKLVDTHILRPSPYFKGQYLTLYNPDHQTVAFEDNGQMIKTLQGFNNEKKVRILSEELAYNKNYEPYKILIIDQPFDSNYGPTTSTKENPIDDLLIPKSTFIESKCFLQSFKEYSKVLVQIDKTITEFNEHYMVLIDYLEDVAGRIQSMILDLAEKCLNCTKLKIHSDPRFRDVLYGAVESYILGLVHNKVFYVICEKHRKEDIDLLKKCHQLENVIPSKLYIPKQFSCPLPTAVFELARLKDYHTPREKLNTLKAVIDSITMEIEEYINLDKAKIDVLPLTKTEIPCLTSDNLIPLLVTVIAQAKCIHLESDLFYMENFNWNSTIKDMDDVSYCLVTFKAAVQYMQTTNFDYLQQNSNSEKGIDEMMSGIKLSQFESASSLDDSGVIPDGSTRVSCRKIRKPNKISTLLHDNNTSSPLGKQEDKKIRSIFDEPSRRTPSHLSQDRNQEDNLGDFLSSLQDDIFDQPFGKQT